MIGGSELSRLILAELPHPASRTGTSGLPPSLPALTARMSPGDLSAAVDAAFAGTQWRTTDAARNALEHTLVDHTLAASLTSPHEDDRSMRDPAQPYRNAIADRATATDPNARSAIDLAVRLAPEPAFALNPALSAVAAELSRMMLVLPAKIGSERGRADALSARHGALTSTEHEPQRATAWSSQRIATGAAALAAGAMAVSFLAYVLGA